MNSTENVSDRPLIAYAFLAQATQVPGDLLSGLAPIFKPIAKQWAGQRFDARQLSAEVRRLYGIDIHPWAVDDLAVRLENANLLIKVKLSAEVAEYVYAPVSDDFDSVSEADIRLVVSRFIKFVAVVYHQYDIQMNEKVLEEAFLDHLVSMDFHSILLKPDRENDRDDSKSGTLKTKGGIERKKWEGQISEKARLNVLCAAFIVETFESDRQLYDLISKIAAGALIAEVVLNLQNPGGTPTLGLLNVVLDAPFLMSLLDLGSEESHLYAREIFSKLKENRATILVFKHSIEEIKFNLQGVLNNVADGRGFGATARRLSNSTFQHYATSVLRDAESAVKGFVARIESVPTDMPRLAYFSKDDEDALFSTLGSYGNPAAQRRDAASIAGVMRLREGRNVRMSLFHQSKYIFVTENPWVAECGDRFTKGRNQRAEDEVPPAVTDRYLAGLLWVLYGGKAEELTRYRLLANCTAALEPRSDVVKKVHKFLSELDETKATRFRALMTDERAGQHLMQLTLGDSLLVKSTDSAESILSQIQEKMSATLEKKYEVILSDTQAEHEEKARALAEEATRLERTLLENDQALIEFSGRLNERENAFQNLQIELAVTKAQHLETKRLAIQRCVGRARLAVRRRQFLIAGILAVLVFAVSLAGSMLGTDHGVVWPILAAALTAGLTLCGFWFVPDLIFYEHLQKLREKVFHFEVDDSSLRNDVDLFVLDWEKFTVSCSSLSLPSADFPRKPV